MNQIDKQYKSHAEAKSVSSQADPDAKVGSLLSLRSVVKSFGKVKALRGVNFDLSRGEVHALLGQNGAGKSTLIKILAGVSKPDEGTFSVLGELREFIDPAAARKAGLAVVYQELSLIPAMTVADNVVLAREPAKLGIVQRSECRRLVQKFLDENGFPLRAGDLIQSLPFAYRQLAEIAKALYGDVKILVLDEPTSSLSKDEEEILFRAIKRITQRGVGVIYVTHRLNEVFKLSDRVTILRDGISVGTFETASADMAFLVNSIVGKTVSLREISERIADEALSGPTTAVLPAGKFDKAAGEVVLELDRVSSKRLRDVSLKLRAGEVLGLAGMVGSGRSEILEAVFGLHKIERGSIALDGRKVKIRNAREAIAMGIGLVPEDRHVQGLVLDHSVEQNIVIPRIGSYSRWGFVQRRRTLKFTKSAIEAFSIKTKSSGTAVGSLSGGNQQKVILGRWRDPVPRILLLDEPTVGVDVSAREQIYGVMRSLTSTGASVILVSSDFNELLLLCDRVAIVSDGAVSESLKRSDIRGENHLHHLIQEATK